MATFKPAIASAFATPRQWSLLRQRMATSPEPSGAVVPSRATVHSVPLASASWMPEVTDAARSRSMRQTPKGVACPGMSVRSTELIRVFAGDMPIFEKVGAKASLKKATRPGRLRQFLSSVDSSPPVALWILGAT